MENNPPHPLVTALHVAPLKGVRATQRTLQGRVACNASATLMQRKCNVLSRGSSLGGADTD